MSTCRCIYRGGKGIKASLEKQKRKLFFLMLNILKKYMIKKKKKYTVATGL